LNALSNSVDAGRILVFEADSQLAVDDCNRLIALTVFASGPFQNTFSRAAVAGKSKRATKTINAMERSTAASFSALLTARPYSVWFPSSTFKQLALAQPDSGRPEYKGALSLPRRLYRLGDRTEPSQS